jgi:hypothetical protein
MIVSVHLIALISVFLCCSAVLFLVLGGRILNFVPYTIEESRLDEPRYLKKSDGSILSDGDLEDLMLRGCPSGNEDARAGPDDDIEEDEEGDGEEEQVEGGEATAPEATAPNRTRGV